MLSVPPIACVALLCLSLLSADHHAFSCWLRRWYMVPLQLNRPNWSFSLIILFASTCSNKKPRTSWWCGLYWLAVAHRLSALICLIYRIILNSKTKRNVCCTYVCSWVGCVQLLPAGFLFMRAFVMYLKLLANEFACMLDLYEWFDYTREETATVDAT